MERKVIEMNDLSCKPNKMQTLSIGMRAHDFHEGLKETSSSAPKEIFFGKTLLIGKAASLAMHLRDSGKLYIENMALQYAASSLGIGSLELDRVLRELEILSFLSVVRSGDQIKRIDVKVPELRSGYAELGERWQQLNPTDVEVAALLSLDTLYQGPQKEDWLRNALNLDPRSYSIMGDVMQAGQCSSRDRTLGKHRTYSRRWQLMALPTTI